MTTRGTWCSRVLVGSAAAVLAVTLAPEVGAVPAQVAPAAGVSGAGVTAASGSAVATGTPYSATPPAGVTCRSVASGSVTYSCVIGRSVEGRPIVATRQGNASSTRVLVVNGQMHGEEWPGTLVVDRIRATPVPASAGFQVWTIRTINPDGGRIGRRRNSHRVDLNRNFPAKFQRMADSGPRALSEPESAAMARFLTWVQPDLLISLHGYSTSVDTTGGGARAAWARRFSGLTRIRPAVPVPCGGPCHGNMTDWYSATSRVGGVAFTVEMPRSSSTVRACSVPGAPARQSTIRCSASAALYLGARLPG